MKRLVWVVAIAWWLVVPAYLAVSGCVTLERFRNRCGDGCPAGEYCTPVDDGTFRECRPIPSPTPIPTTKPTPTPEPKPTPIGPPVTIPTPKPAPAPSPTPSPIACPPLLEVGGSMLQPRYCAPGCVKDGYLGYVVNWTGTPLISSDTGLCAPGRNRCEMPKACQDPRGVYTWLYMPGVFGLGICDERSDNPFNCHHKPRANEVGVTYFVSCPWGVMPPEPPARHPLCTIQRVDVRPDRPVELK